MKKNFLHLLFVLFTCLLRLTPVQANIIEARWGTADVIWSSNTLEQLTTVKNCGFRYIEVNLSNKYLDTAYQQNLKKMYDEVGLQAWSAHMPYGAFDISVLDEEVRRDRVEKMKTGIQNAATILGAKHLVIHASNDGVPATERTQRLAKARESIVEMQAFADGLNLDVVICVEVLPRACLGNTPEELLYMIEGTNARICYDTNHYSGTPQYFIDTAGHKIATVHFSDYDFAGEQHWLPGQGSIAWGELVHMLDETGYTGVLISESLKDRNNGNAPITIQQLAEAYRTFSDEYEALKDPQRRLDAKLTELKKYYFPGELQPEDVFPMGADPGFYSTEVYQAFDNTYKEAQTATTDFDSKRISLIEALKTLLGASNPVEPGYYWIETASSYFLDLEEPVYMAMYSDDTNLLKWKKREDDLRFLFKVETYEDGFSFRNMYDDTYIGSNPANSQPVSMTAEPQHVQYVTFLGRYGNITLSNNLNSTPYHMLSHGSGKGTGSNIVQYSGDVRSASAWYLRKVDQETVDVLLASKAQILAEKVKNIVEQRGSLINTVFGFPEPSLIELGTAYEAYMQAPDAENAFKQLQTAYGNLLTTRIQPTEGQVYRLKNFYRKTFMGSQTSYLGEGSCLKDSTDEGCLWILKAEGNGWKLKNLKRDAYLGRMHDTSDPVAYNTTDAGIYTISPVEKENNILTLFNVNTTNSPTYSYLHTQGSNLLAWNGTSPSSHWVMQVVPEDFSLDQLYANLGKRICQSAAQDGWPGTYAPENTEELRNAYAAYTANENEQTLAALSAASRSLATTKERCGIRSDKIYRLVNVNRLVNNKQVALAVGTQGEQSIATTIGISEDTNAHTTGTDLWSIASSTDAKLCMRTANGMYLQGFGSNTYVTAGTDEVLAGFFSFGVSEEGTWTIRNIDKNMLHASGSGNIIGYNDTFSLWYFEEVPTIDTSSDLFARYQSIVVSVRKAINNQSPWTAGSAVYQYTSFDKEAAQSALDTYTTDAYGNATLPASAYETAVAALTNCLPILNAPTAGQVYLLQSIVSQNYVKATNDGQLNLEAMNNDFSNETALMVRYTAEGKLESVMSATETAATATETPTLTFKTHPASAGNYLCLDTNGNVMACCDGTLNLLPQDNASVATEASAWLLTPVQNWTVNLNNVSESNNWATFYADKPVHLPVGISARYVESGTLTETGTAGVLALGYTTYQGSLLPACTGVLLASKTAGQQTIYSSIATGVPAVPNLFKGIANEGETLKVTGTLFALGHPEGEIPGFYRYDATDGFAPNKAYLDLILPADQANTASILLVEHPGTPTGIESVTDQDNENGSVYYDLSGKRVTNPTRPGIYIKNHKKEVVK